MKSAATFGAGVAAGVVVAALLLPSSSFECDCAPPEPPPPTVEGGAVPVLPDCPACAPCVEVGVAEQDTDDGEDNDQAEDARETTLRALNEAVARLSEDCGISRRNTLVDCEVFPCIVVALEAKWDDMSCMAEGLSEFELRDSRASGSISGIDYAALEVGPENPDAPIEVSLRMSDLLLKMITETPE